MRKPEQKQWDYLSRAMAGRWDAQRHEDKHSDSIPDVSYAMGGAGGWIELKTIPHWPKKPHLPVSVPHLKPGQVNWLEARGKAGNGRCFVLLAVGEDMRTADWVLIPWREVRGVYERSYTKAELLGLCPYFAGMQLKEIMPQIL